MPYSEKLYRLGLMQIIAAGMGLGCVTLLFLSLKVLKVPLRERLFKF
jgi:hypothetical protein